ncbi:MAG: hypothetical protein ACKOX6_16360 [Bdellovibrio sp.]
MKTIIAVAITFVSLNSFAELVTIGCKPAQTSCEERVVQALAYMGCEPQLTEAITCHSHSGGEFENCIVETLHCSSQSVEPVSGESYICRRDFPNEISLRAYDKTLTAHWEENIFGQYKSGAICTR